MVTGILFFLLLNSMLYTALCVLLLDLVEALKIDYAIRSTIERIFSIPNRRFTIPTSISRASEWPLCLAFCRSIHFANSGQRRPLWLHRSEMPPIAPIGTNFPSDTKSISKWLSPTRMCNGKLADMGSSIVISWLMLRWNDSKFWRRTAFIHIFVTVPPGLSFILSYAQECLQLNNRTTKYHSNSTIYAIWNRAIQDIHFQLFPNEKYRYLLNWTFS